MPASRVAWYAAIATAVVWTLKALAIWEADAALGAVVLGFALFVALDSAADALPDSTGWVRPSALTRGATRDPA